MTRSIGSVLAACMLLLASACAPLQQGALKFDSRPEVGFSDKWFTSFDGARLGLDVFKAAAPASSEAFGPSADEVRETVIVAVHGMNDYAGAFKAAGTWWAEHGATV